MKSSFKTGLSFGLTSGVITTLGLMIGLYATTYSKLVVIGGILSIAIADALSDAMGIHVAQENNGQSTKAVWEATLATFFSKFIFSLTFIIPILFLELKTAIITSSLWGLFLIGASTIYMNKEKDRYKQLLEHLAMAIAVIIITFFLGQWIAATFQ